MRFACLLLIAACASPTPPEPGASPTVVASAGPSAPAPSASATASSSSTKPEPAATSCTADSQCGWNDACVPTRCQIGGDTERTNCDESAPDPGLCLCLEGACTLKPKVIPPPSGTCEVRGCQVDRGAGKCIADTGGVPEPIRSTPPVNQGPSCDCIKPSEGCTFSWFDPVPCKSVDDCWVSSTPRKHPIARPKGIGKRAFKPCSDGEVPPVCSNAGFCALGPGYSC